jgi:hypothetical protein
MGSGMNDQDARISALLNRVQRLSAKARSLSGEHLPIWRRVMNYHKSVRIINRAADLLYEVDAIQGKPRPAQIWLGMGRRGIMRLQWLLGIMNAYAMIGSFHKGQYIAGTVSALCILVTALWRLPYAPPKA